MTRCPRVRARGEGAQSSVPSPRVILASNALPARSSHFSSAIAILKLCVYAQQHPPLPEFQPKSRAFPFVGHRAAGAPESAARSPTTISPKPRGLSAGDTWLSLSRVREAGTGPELTPTRVGAGGGAAALERERGGGRAPRWGRGVSAERSRRRRALAQAARRRRRGRGRGAGVRGEAARRGLESVQKRPRILTQPGFQALSFRLRHIAAARAGPAASNLARTRRRGAGAGPAWGPERSGRRHRGSRRTATDDGRASVSFVIRPFGPRNERVLMPRRMR